MKSKQIFFFMVGMLIATLLATAGGLYLADSYLVGQAQTISDLRADDEALTSALLRAQQTEDNLEKYDYLNDVASEVLPGSKNQSEVILILSEIGESVGIDLNTYNFQSTEDLPGNISQTIPVEGAPNILLFPIDISFKGTFDEILNWLEEAEKNRRKFQISTIAISPDQSDEINPYSVSMTINAYVEK